MVRRGCVSIYNSGLFKCTFNMCPIFTGTHYHVLAVKMKVYLRSLGLGKVVETDEEPPALSESHPCSTQSLK
ncbi:hypothetical protein GQ457_04G014150 [Hibiscus cannabinus]